MGLSQAIMIISIRQISLCSFILLSGCSILPEWFRPISNEPKDSIYPSPLGEPGNKSQYKKNKAPLIQPVAPLLHEPTNLKLPIISDINQSLCKTKIGVGKEIAAIADPSNFDNRLTVDQWGRSIAHTPKLIVLHETVLNEKETINLFKTQHLRDQDQASYHLLVTRDGSLLRVVPDSERAFGSGMSAFGDVTQRTKNGSVGSINNISLHISLVSPEDGRDDRAAHSGYTDLQYKSLAQQVLLWQAKFGIPLTRVTTHAAVDRSHSRYDPRSFRWDRFDLYYKEFASICSLEYLDNGLASF